MRIMSYQDQRCYGDRCHDDRVGDERSARARTCEPSDGADGGRACQARTALGDNVESSRELTTRGKWRAFVVLRTGRNRGLRWSMSYALSREWRRLWQEAEAATLVAEFGCSTIASRLCGIAAKFRMLRGESDVLHVKGGVRALDRPRLPLGGLSSAKKSVSLDCTDWEQEQSFLA